MSAANENLYLYHHVFLPPNLPQADDYTAKDEHALARTMHECARTFKETARRENYALDATSWSQAIPMLNSLVALSANSPLREEDLFQELHRLRVGDISTHLIRAQNAGIIIRLGVNEAVFEVFEISAPNAAVMACSGKLLSTYPAHAVPVPLDIFRNARFQRNLASFLCQMNTDALEEDSYSTTKTRDQPHPRLITDLLVTILAGTDELSAIQVPARRITKRIADDVLGHNMTNPWRRSKMWLVIRVALQTTLPSRDYKAFMLFAMTVMLERSLTAGGDNDAIRCMATKCHRRALKFVTTHNDGSIGWIKDRMSQIRQRVQQLLSDRWDTAQSEIERPVVGWDPTCLFLDHDTDLRLENSAPVIARILDRSDPIPSVSSLHRPNLPRRLAGQAFNSILQITSFHSAETNISLIDFECATREYLQEWTTSHLNSPSAEATLLNVIRVYQSAASVAYKFNAESRSLMILTILDLWRSIDQIAIAQCPMLADYPPEVKASLLEPLLLRHKEDLDRVSAFAAYIHAREQNVRYKRNSVFRATATEHSFAIRFFEQSLALQQALRGIETRAENDRRAKVHEMTDLNQRYHSLIARAASLACQNHRRVPVYTRRRRGVPETRLDTSDCRACQLKEEASSLTITVHEWPLPFEPIKAKVAVFEQNCPSAFAIWRDATYAVLHDLLTPQDKQSTPDSACVTLDSYMEGMLPCTGPTRSISLASSVRSNRKSLHFPVYDEAQVCVLHAPKWELYNTGRYRWITPESCERADTQSKCCLAIPDNSLYKPLQFSIPSTTHFSNTVLAAQAACPRDLSLHEFISFGTLRAGGTVQWMNIIRELAANDLAYNHDGVYVLLAQAIQQVGSITRAGQLEWHSDLTADTFGDVLIREAKRMHSNVADNWQEVATLKAVTLIFVRLLGAAPSERIVHESCIALRDVRETLYAWLKQLLSSFGDQNDTQVDYVKSRIRDVAATCRMTYDLDTVDLVKVLHTARDLEILLHCGIVLYDNRASELSTSAASRTVFDRGLRVMLKSEERIRQMISVDPEGIDSAVRAVWPSFSRGTPWRSLPDANKRWMCCETSALGSSLRQNVQMDVLDGRLLIDGKPLGTLPVEITSHPVYKRLFGGSMLLVIPANLPGMEFQSRALVEGSQVYFSLRNEELIVKAMFTDGKMRQYIPWQQFLGDLPTPLVDDYIHWLDVSDDYPHWLGVTTHTIQLMPLNSPWTASPPKYQLQFRGQHSRLYDQQRRALIEPSSETFLMVHNRLRCIEEGRYMIMFHDSSPANDRPLSAHLPRFKLDFVLNLTSSALECSNISGTVVDDNQSLGALHGLMNKLVLREQGRVYDEITKPRLRSVLIPTGDVAFAQQDHHVAVTINVGNVAQVKYNVYSVDTLVGRLVDDGTLSSRLYKIYLLALTSHWLPDDLTGRTGTEEALSELNSARCMSFMALSPRDIQLLSSIKCLSPKRVFHPAHLRVMQTVEWCDLPMSSQAYDFEQAVLRILDFDRQVSVFEESAGTSRVSLNDSDYQSRSVETLIPRAQARELSARPLVLTAQGQRSHTLDVIYASRAQHDFDESSCYLAARAITEESPSLFGYDYSRSNALYSEFRELGWLTSESHPRPRLSYSRYWKSNPDLKKDWLILYEICRDSTVSRERKRFQLLFSLPTHLYLGSNARLVAHMLAFCFDPSFQAHNPPRWSTYTLGHGIIPSQTFLKDSLYKCKKPIESTASASLPRIFGEEEADWRERRKDHYRTIARGQSNNLAIAFLEQWPCASPNLPPGDFDYLDTSAALTEATSRFQSCFHNRDLRAFAENVQGELVHIPSLPANTTLHQDIADVPEPPVSHLAVLPSFLNMASRQAPAPYVTDCTPTLQYDREIHHPYEEESARRLQNTVQLFAEDSSRLARAYGADLQRSLKSLEMDASRDLTQLSDPSDDIVSTAAYLEHCDHEYRTMLQILVSAIQPITSVEELAQWAGLDFPRPTARSMLSFMTSDHWEHISVAWKESLIIFALSMARLQQAHRMIDFERQGRYKEAYKEFDNLVRLVAAHDVYLEHPDWLLIQIESDVHMRDLQTQVAQQMFRPSLGSNAALQLNMGEGKSSVITPMVAASLSNGDKLVRVIVLKSLVPQMFQLLLTRLGDLCNRRVFFLPFSRQMKVDSRNMGLIRTLYDQCMISGGVLIAQPEHILSAKLLSVEQVLAAESSTSSHQQPLEVQRFLSQHSRDLLDESDELLHVRYQLIYTMGHQHAMDGHPDRWRLIQNTLSLAMKFAESLQEETREFTVDRSQPWAFPRIAFSATDNAEVLKVRLREKIVDSIVIHGLPGLSVAYLHVETRALLKQFLIRKEISAENRSDLLQVVGESSMTWKAILILRGILAYDILLYALCERRWRVDYGLDRGRSLLAVPYRAKDVPSLRAEFGHPDVAIILTCLAYHYHGLTSKEVAAVVKRLLKTSNPDVEYQAWIDCIPADMLPESLGTVRGINTEDRLQHSKTLFPLFQFNRETIDFYLREVVFPKAAKEFPYKLPTSGWDLAETKQHITTGFSGTNDNRFLLPSSITQVDPCNQDATNALVLSHLLNRENSHYLCARDTDGRSISGKALVDIVARSLPKVRVLLDVGAQVLDLSNLDLVQHWLVLDTSQEAAIFFNDVDELTVVSRDGTIESFLTSPYRNQTQKCLVYLDDAHTRGTDLKLPSDARAAVTLGRKVTKDRLVQGCMRMRQLGHGQSVMFIAPPETDSVIRKTCNVPSGSQVQVQDILRWSMEETLADIRHHLPYWATQGADYRDRRDAMLRLPDDPSPADIVALKDTWLQRESRSLSEMYNPEPQRNASVTSFPPEVTSRLQELDVSGALEHAVDEEQEREVSHEMEIERQIERPRPVKASIPFVHRDLMHFVKTGQLLRRSEAFVQLSVVLRDVPNWSRHRWGDIIDAGLIATRDFDQTVQRQSESFDDIASEYLNPIRWLLTGRDQRVLVIVSQFEAQSLLEHIRSSAHVHLHVYTPRTTKSMPVFDDLQFYCTPPMPHGDGSLSQVKSLVTQLNVFAGQLYPTSYQDYETLCDFLGVDLTGEQQADSDGFVRPEYRTRAGTSASPFVSSPIPFLKALMSLRRKHQDFELTPIGKLLEGRAGSVSASDF